MDLEKKVTSQAADLETIQEEITHLIGELKAATSKVELLVNDMHEH